jgi:alpha-beta hydrolase superfamily lysophospholipase
VELIRLEYRTTRGAPAGSVEALAGALLVVPERVRDPNVLVVAAHGTLGFGDRCQPSHAPLSPLTRRLASEGWITVLPDYAHSGYGEGASGWMNADDEARSIFDAIRAVHRAMPEGRRPKRVVLIGHSQGGHAVLAAQALARTEDLPAEIVGVAASAPMWFPPRLFARMITRDAKRPDAGARDLLWALYYFYGHAELEEGPGHGLDILDPSTRERLGSALRSGCNVDVEAALGSRAPSEVFTSSFLEALRTCDEGGACSPEAARWMRRFARDWPEIDPKGAPVLLLQGTRDTHVTLPRVRCAMDRLTEALPAAELRLCGDAASTHTGVIFDHLDDVMNWTAQRAVRDHCVLACDPDLLRSAAAGATCPIDDATPAVAGVPR